MNDGHSGDGDPSVGWRSTRSTRPSRATTARRVDPGGPGPRDRTGRVEARDGLAGRGSPEAFDFVVEGSGTDPALGILATYLGAAACEQSRTLAHGVDVDRVLVEVERPSPLPDGGTDWSGDGVTSAGEPPRRVRAVVEVLTAAPTDVCGVLGDRLGADRVPVSIVPDLVGVEVRASPRAVSSRAVADD